MSLRFLKAKPKLNLSKDNKVRSVTSKSLQKTESILTDGQENVKCTSDIIVPSVQENDTQAQILNNSIDSQNSSRNVSSEDTITQKTNKELDPLVSKKDIETTKSIETVQSSNNTKTNSLIKSDKSSVVNKFRFLKVKPKLGSNIPSKNRTNLSTKHEENEEKKKEEENKSKINDTSHNTTSSEPTDKQNEQKTIDVESATKKDTTHADKKPEISRRLSSENSSVSCVSENMKEDKSKNVLFLPPKKVLSKEYVTLKNHKLEFNKNDEIIPLDNLNSLTSRQAIQTNNVNYPEKSTVSKLEKVSPTKTKSLSSYIKQLEHETLLSSQQNSVKSMAPVVRQEQTFTKHQESRNLISNVMKVDKQNVVKVSNVKQNVVTVPHDKQNAVQVSNDKQTEAKVSQDKQNVVIVSHDKQNAVKVTNELKTKDFNKVIESNENSENEIKKVEIRKPPKKRIIAENVQTKVQKISDLIHENMNLLKEPPKNSLSHIDNEIKNSINLPENKIDDKSITSNIKGITVKGKSDNASTKCFILNEENIKTMPIIIEEPQMNSNAINNVVPELLDHVYAKCPSSISTSIANDMVGCIPNTSEVVSYNKPEKNLDSVKLRNFCHDEKIKKKQSSSMQLADLNPFQRALLMEESKIEDDQRSEASECDTRPFVDVNSCTFITLDNEEEAPVSNISYSFKDSGMNAFSGLSLITKLIKEEVGDPFLDDPLGVTGMSLFRCSNKVNYYSA